MAEGVGKRAVVVGKVTRGIASGEASEAAAYFASLTGKLLIRLTLLVTATEERPYPLPSANCSWPTWHAATAMLMLLLHNVRGKKAASSQGAKSNSQKICRLLWVALAWLLNSTLLWLSFPRGNR